MVQRINGRLLFIYGVLKKEYHKLIRINLSLSLLVVLVGIFLLPNSAYLSTIQPEKLIELTNQAREAQGLSSLTANQLLTQAAILKGQAILESNAFKHTINDKKFSAWVRDAGYNYSYVGENLAVDFFTSEGIIEAWKNSPLHRKNLLSPYYREIGISTMTGKFQGQDTTVVVQIFGAPAAQTAAPWEVNSGLLSSNLNNGETNLLEPQFKTAENLLTHAIINQKTLPLDNNKLTLPADNYEAGQANTFVIQPNYQETMNNLLIIFSTLIAAYLLIFLYSYYLFKINKLVSA